MVLTIVEDQAVVFRRKTTVGGDQEMEIPVDQESVNEDKVDMLIFIITYGKGLQYFFRTSYILFQSIHLLEF